MKKVLFLSTMLAGVFLFSNTSFAATKEQTVIMPEAKTGSIALDNDNDVFWKSEGVELIHLDIDNTGAKTSRKNVWLDGQQRWSYSTGWNFGKTGYSGAYTYGRHGTWSTIGSSKGYDEQPHHVWSNAYSKGKISETHIADYWW